MFPFGDSTFLANLKNPALMERNWIFSVASVPLSFKILGLWVLGFRPGVVLHLRCPLEKASELFPFSEQKAPELQKSDFVHFETGIRFHAPAQIRAAPGSQVMPTA